MPQETGGGTAATDGGRADTDGRALLERAIQDAPVGMVVTDPDQPDNPIIHVNDRFCQMTGYDRTAVLGQNCRFLQGEETREEPVAAMRQAVEAEESVTVELRNYRRDGTMFWNRVQVSPLRAEDGTVTHFVGFQEPIDEAKARERQLARSRERFRALTENTSLGVLTVDAESTVRYANDAVETIFGYEPAELVGESLLTVMPARFHEDHRAAVERYLREGTHTLDWEWIEFPGETADGEEVPLGISFGEATVDGESRFTAVLRDISEQKAWERERQSTLSLLQTLYNVSTDAELEFEAKVEVLLEVVAEQLDLEYGFLTQIDTQADGGGRQEIIYSYGDHRLLQPGEHCPLEEAYCRKTIGADGLLAVADAVEAGWKADPAYETFGLGSYVGATVRVDDDLYGTVCFASADPREQAFTDAEGTFVRLLGRWLSYELERRQVTAELQRQNERLDEFASILAHDLRNPLNVAQGHLELAREEADTDHLETVETSLDRIETMIEDVLALARSGRSSVEIEAVDLGDLARDCWASVQTRSGTLRTPTEATVLADPGRLRQILENLVRNAIEHAGEDVTVTVGDLPDGFFVADDGPGIPVGERDDVLASGYSSEAENTGFGLAIVAEIADAHGWEVTITESADGGARFEFTDVDVADE